MEEENEQLDYDELDDLETARKKCKELQKAVEIDTLQAVKESSNERIEENDDDVQKILTCTTIQSQIESTPTSSQNQSSTAFPSTNVFSTITSSIALYSSNTPPPPGISTIPLISSIPPPITTNILRPSLNLQQQGIKNKFYVNPKFNNNNKHFYHYNKKNSSKNFYNKKFPQSQQIIGSGGYHHPSMPITMTSQFPGATAVHLPLVGGILSSTNNLNIQHGIAVPPIINQQISSSSTSFLQQPHGNNIYINRSVLHTTSSWNAMVDEFVRKNVSSGIHSRHYNPSFIKHSRSRSSSTSTFRRSNSSSSDSSNVSQISRNKRSGSITDASITNDHSKRRRLENVGTDHQSRRHNNGHQSLLKKNKKRDERNEERIAHNQAIECARAIGLDEDYLKKIEEQQRLRDEILRRKTLKRKEKEAAIKGMEILTRKGEGSKNEELFKVDKEFVDKQKEVDQLKTETQQIKHSSINLIRKTNEKINQKEENINKLRPYLAVVCTNLKGIANVQKKIEGLAAAVGKTKKIWRVGADDCHIIFEKHEHAKEFMLQYYGKKLGNVSSTCIDVVLKKVFLNISSHSTD